MDGGGSKGGPLVAVICKGARHPQDPGAVSGPWALSGDSSPGRGSLENGVASGSCPYGLRGAPGPVCAPPSIETSPPQKPLFVGSWPARWFLRSHFLYLEKGTPLAAASSVFELGSMFLFWDHMRFHHHPPASWPVGLGWGRHCRDWACTEAPLPNSVGPQGPGGKDAHCTQLTPEALRTLLGADNRRLCKGSLSRHCRTLWTAAQNSLQLSPSQTPSILLITQPPLGANLSLTLDSF